MHTTRSKLDHRERRKLWDRAFSAKALREYEPRLNRHALMFIEQLKERVNAPSLRLSEWINYYSFDVMGDIGFSRSFGMLEKGKEDELIKGLHKNMAGFSYFTQMVWILGLLLRTAGAKDVMDFTNWAIEVLKERKQVGRHPRAREVFQDSPYTKRTPAETDVFSWIMNPDDEKIPLNLTADTKLMIIAGRYSSHPPNHTPFLPI